MKFYDPFRTITYTKQFWNCGIFSHICSEVTYQTHLNQIHGHWNKKNAKSWNYRGKALSDDLYLSCSDRCFRRMKSLEGPCSQLWNPVEIDIRKFSFKKKKSFFNWRRIALQCCIGFCCVTTGISRNYTFIYPLLKTFLWSLESEALFTGPGWMRRCCWWVSVPWSLGTAVLL